MFTVYSVSFQMGLGYNKVYLCAKDAWEEVYEMSATFWIMMVTIAMFLAAMLTAAYNEDKTRGL